VYLRAIEDIKIEKHFSIRRDEDLIEYKLCLIKKVANDPNATYIFTKLLKCERQ
jgi:hypothetical protein